MATTYKIDFSANNEDAVYTIYFMLDGNFSIDKFVKLLEVWSKSNQIDVSHILHEQTIKFIKDSLWPKFGQFKESEKFFMQSYLDGQRIEIHISQIFVYVF